MELTTIDHIKQSLSLITSPDEIKDLRGKAAAIEVYGRRQKNREVQNQGALGCIRCDQRLAELVNEMQDKGELPANGRPKKLLHHEIVLGDLDITTVELHRCRRLLEVPESTLQEYLNSVLSIPDGELTIAGLLRYVSGQAVDIERISAKSTNEWYTPKRYIDAAHAVLGQIDIDPASNDKANETIQASTIYTKDDDGLQYDWPGKVWLNPPYGGISKKFVAKLVEQFETRITNEAILLVNANSTDTGWFVPLWNYLLCFTDHRIDFICSESKASGSTHGSVFVYMGDNPKGFIDNFKQFGPIVRRVDD